MIGVNWAIFLIKEPVELVVGNTGDIKVSSAHCERFGDSKVWSGCSFAFFLQFWLKIWKIHIWLLLHYSFWVLVGLILPVLRLEINYLVTPGHRKLFHSFLRAREVVSFILAGILGADKELLVCQK